MKYTVVRVLFSRDYAKYELIKSISSALDARSERRHKTQIRISVIYQNVYRQERGSVEAPEELAEL